MAHKGHPKCVYTSVVACEKARREALGKCTELTADDKKPTPCRLWAMSLVGDRGMCNMHAGKVIERQAAERIESDRQAARIAAIDGYLARTGQSSAHQCGERCSFIEHPDRCDPETCPYNEHRATAASPAA